MRYLLENSGRFKIFMLTIILFSCQENPQEKESESGESLFSALDASSTGIDFENTLEESVNSNYFKYMYSYIGAGVAAADFNNDGLQDIFFVSNQKENKLYINQGDFKFDDVTGDSGIMHKEGFDTGVTVVDINNDGLQDIYICRGGWIQENDGFANLLYINQGVSENNIPIFREESARYGINDKQRGIQSTFFDYDKDGDLDLFIANAPDFDNPAAEVFNLTEVQSDPKTIELKGSDQLYQNKGDGTFSNVSIEAGILPEIGFGLNPQVSDLDNDGWLDIYVCNDFRIPDYVYLNNGDGTFREGRNELLKHMSFNSMGSDIADVNNDGLQDIYTLDMNPEDYIRSKTTMGMTSQSRFEEMVSKNYHYQYMHNMLHLNTGNQKYSEVSKLAGIADTDWSWSCLLADFDLDGLNDVYVTNGVYRDVIDRDANNQILQDLRAKNKKPTDEDFLRFAKMLPQQKIVNYIFRNNGNLSFEDVSSKWTTPEETFSNGAVYVDLDNDGDLEVVVNNINQPATILKNSAVEKNQGNYITVELKGHPENRNGIGATIKILLSNQETLVRQQIRTRGFLSSVSEIIHFGLNKEKTIEQLSIIWPDGKSQIFKEIPINQKLILNYANAGQHIATTSATNPLVKKLAIDIKHIDPPHNDYNYQILLPHKLSQTGPALAKADVNGDGIEDVFIGGGAGQESQIYLGNKKGSLQFLKNNSFSVDKQKEDVAACFFDADADGDLDLYVASGSYEFVNNPRQLVDRIYLNDGNGNMKKNSVILPEFVAAGSVVKSADFDADGDIDLFVGSRVVPGQYPFAPTNYLLEQVNGTYQVSTETLAPDLENIGMITDAQWADIDGDDDIDLIVSGEWMGIEVFLNTNGKLMQDDSYQNLSTYKGWWNTIEIADIDNDQDLDIIAGNLGLNSKYQASTEKPFHVYTSDFDYNGSTDVFLAKYYKDEEVPVRGKTCATQQLPHLANKIKSYNEFANSNLADIIGPGIKSALHLTVTEFRSGIFINSGEGNFDFKPFENSIQRSPINSIVFDDLNNDGHADLILAGNNYMPEIETTRYDAGVGSILMGDGVGNFELKSNQETGFWTTKDVRNIEILSGAHKRNKHVIIANNNDSHQFYRIIN